MVTALFITARLKSTRLPRKVLAPIAGKPVLAHLIDRVKRARFVDHFVLCTSTLEEDDPLAELAHSCGILTFRGAPHDVLERYRGACLQLGIDFFAVTWGDEPLCDPAYIERVITAGELADFVYVEGLPTGTFTYGVGRAALERVCREKVDEETEVWAGYFTKNPAYRVVQLTAERQHQRSDVRLTIDYPEDLQVLNEVFTSLGSEGRYFGLDEVLTFLDLHPRLKLVNNWLEAPYRRRIEEQARDRLKE